jgi:uncharacterized membrane protein
MAKKKAAKKATKKVEKDIQASVSTEEVVKTMQKLMHWLDKLYIKRLVDEKAAMMKEAGELIQKLKAE